MSTETTPQGFFRGFFTTFFKTIAIGCGLVAVLFLFAILFTKKEMIYTTVRPLRNHDWQLRPFSPKVPTIFQLDIEGHIGVDQLTKDAVTLKVMEALDSVVAPGELRAILLRVNCPGGVAFDTDSIYRLLLQVRKRYKIPIYAYIDGLCASGATYIACAANKIIASRTSWIGNVGTIMPTFFNYSKTLDNIGIDSKTVLAGKHKDMMNPFREWKKDESTHLQELVDQDYAIFKEIVAERRPKITIERLDDIGADIFMAEEAQKIGFIDEINDDYSDVLKELAEHVGIVDKYQVIELELPNLFENVFGSKNAQNWIEQFLTNGLGREFHGKPLHLWRPQARSE